MAKTTNQESGLGNREPLKALNDTKLILNEHEWHHLGSIWCHSEPSDVPYFPNQILDLDFFCRFLQQDSSNTVPVYIYLPRTKSISLSRLGKWKWGKIYHGQGVWYTRWDNSLTSFVHYIYHQNILTWTFFMVFCTVKDHCTKGWNPLWSMCTSNILIVSYKRS